MKTVEEAKKEAIEATILSNKEKLEHEGITLTADEYVSAGSTYKLYALSLATGMTHNNLKQKLNEMNIIL